VRTKQNRHAFDAKVEEFAGFLSGIISIDLINKPTLHYYKFSDVHFKLLTK